MGPAGSLGFVGFVGSKESVGSGGPREVRGAVVHSWNRGFRGVRGFVGSVESVGSKGGSLGLCEMKSTEVLADTWWSSNVIWKPQRVCSRATHVVNYA